jgi:hypothetical protein
LIGHKPYRGLMRSIHNGNQTTANFSSGAVWPLLMLIIPRAAQDTKTYIYILRGSSPVTLNSEIWALYSAVLIFERISSYKGHSKCFQRSGLFIWLYLFLNESHHIKGIRNASHPQEHRKYKLSRHVRGISMDNLELHI